MGFSRQEYRSELPFPPPGDLPDSGTDAASPMPPTLAGRFFTTSTASSSVCCAEKLQNDTSHNNDALLLGEVSSVGVLGET